MNKTECLNLTDLTPYGGKEMFGNCDSFIEEQMTAMGIRQLSRIIIGSYFCSRFLLHIDDAYMRSIINYCITNVVDISLVVPVFAENLLESGEKKIMSLCDSANNRIDEICVNDYGMLNWVADKLEYPIALGRLFIKDMRDPRYPDLRTALSKPLAFNRHLVDLIAKYKITSIEVDPIYKEIDCSIFPEELEIAIHTPYSYMTCGQICPFASIPYNFDHKFRPNLPCHLECLQNHMIYAFDTEKNSFDADLLHHGRAIYYETAEPTIISRQAVRLYHWPLRIGVN
jgi:hypothetical protein